MSEDLKAMTIAPDKIADPIRQSLHAVIDAWEALPGGKNYRPGVVADWLESEMAPAIDAARHTLGRDKPGPT